MARRTWKKEVAPFTAMAAVEFATVGLNTLYKAATLKGLSYFIFMAYTYVLGTLVLVTLPFIFKRRELPSFQWSFLYRVVLAALIGISYHVCAYKGIEYSSPTLASAISNLSPAFTFILAVIFSFSALVAVLYKGPTVRSSASSSPSESLSFRFSLETFQENWIKGGLLLVFQNLLGSIWYIMQTEVIKMYPNEQIVTLIYFMCKTIIVVPICFLAETKWSAWTLRPDIALVTIVLSGFFGPSFSSLLHTWGLHLKGPLYISIFKPFSIAIAAMFGVLFLGDALYLGSVVGATILLLGFYTVLWGKAQEEDDKDCRSDYNLRASPDRKTPLLQSYRLDDMENNT